MAKIDISEADQIAVDQIISALQDNYATFLTAVRDTNLTMPAPASDAFYAYLVNPLELFGRDTTNRPNHGVTCFISDTDDRVIQNKRSGGPLFYVADSYIDIEVSIAFVPDPNEAITKNSKTLDPKEIARLRAKRYMEALRKCIYRHGCATSKIHHIDIIQSSNRIDVVDNQEIGYSRVKFRCFQQVKIPFPVF